MCGRYTLYKTEDHLSDRFNLAAKPMLVADNYNVAPGQSMPVVINRQGKNLAELMQWGLVPKWIAKPGLRLINARAESLFIRPTWGQIVKQCRCIVPANGFYEWKMADGIKQPFYIQLKNQQFIAFAGLWNSVKDAEGYEIKTFSIITTKANEKMSEIHDRMPVILKPEDESRWLESSLEAQEVKSLLEPCEDKNLEIYMVNPDVNNPRSSGNHLIDRLVFKSPGVTN